MGVPVAVKAEGSGIAHRTEAGAVRTGLASPDAVGAAFEAVAAACAAHGDAVVVQAMAAPGIEAFVSVVDDAEVGPVALCRPGGVLVELGAATTVLTGARPTWARLLTGSPLWRLLAGHRGRPPADVDGFLDLVEALVAVVASSGGIATVECNPVVVHPADRPPDTAAATIIDLVTARSP